MHRHSQGSHFRVFACEGHPGDVQGVREGAKRLGPDDAKVPNAAEVTEFGEGAIKDVTKKMAEEACNDCFCSLVASRLLGHATRQGVPGDVG